jgi:hypothetical protein
VSGDLQIVVSADLGEFGPKEGKPVIYHFNPIYHAQGFIPWLILTLVFVALKENRTPKAAWILAPIALLSIVFLAAMNILKMTSGSAVQFNVIFTIMVLGFSLIWLLAERIGNRNRFVTFLLATLIYYSFLGVNLLSNGFSKHIISIVALAAVSIPAIILAFVFAALYSKNSFNTARFIIYIGAALFGVSLTIFTIIFSIFYPTFISEINRWIVELLTVSFFSSLIYYVGLLPFLILLFSNIFWRKRFKTVLGIQTKIPIEPSPPINTHNNPAESNIMESA